MGETDSFLDCLQWLFLPLSNPSSPSWILCGEVQLASLEVSQSGFGICVGGHREEFPLNSIETALYLMAYVTASLQDSYTMILPPDIHPLV